MASRRLPQLDAIQRTWELVSQAGSSQVVVVSGESGAGKSRMVAEALDLLSPSPASVLLGSSRSRTPSPYDWLATALRHRPAQDLPAQLRRDGAGQAMAADALAWLTQSQDAPSRRLEPTVLLRAAIEVVRHLVGDGPGVLVVEDFHALDPASLALISDLATATETATLLIIVTRPPDSAKFPTPAAKLLDRLDGECVRLSVEDLEFGEGEAAWARYTHALGRYPEAAQAALRGAARLLSQGRDGEAVKLIDSCLTTDTIESDEPAQLVLARSLLHLGRVEAAEAVARRAVGAGIGGVEAARLRDTVAAVSELTAREREVLACLAAGMTNRQVARSLGISIRTVTVHVSNLLRKTGTGSRTEAALWAVQHGLSG